jgi:hypothetical protein
MDMGIDQSWACSDAVSVDDEVAILQVVIRHRTDLGDLVTVDQDRVPIDQRLAPVAGNDAADIYDGSFHMITPMPRWLEIR